MVEILNYSLTCSDDGDHSLCLQVVFEAQRGSSASCDSALDNIIITEGECPGGFRCMHTHTKTKTPHWINVDFLSTACESGCDFDNIGNLCGWTTYNDNTETFGFGQWAGPTDTEGTGPDDDFSKPGRKWINFIWFVWKPPLNTGCRGAHLPNIILSTTIIHSSW